MLTINATEAGAGGTQCNLSSFTFKKISQLKKKLKIAMMIRTWGTLRPLSPLPPSQKHREVFLPSGCGWKAPDALPTCAMFQAPKACFTTWGGKPTLLPLWTGHRGEEAPGSSPSGTDPRLESYSSRCLGGRACEHPHTPFPGHTPPHRGSMGQPGVARISTKWAQRAAT